MTTSLIGLSSAARHALQKAAAEAGESVVRVTINERFEYDIRFAARDDRDIEVECGGVVLVIDPSSATRAEGAYIDFVTGSEGSGFTVDNPNRPVLVRQLSAPGLRALLDSGVPFELIDVRTEDERAIATIEGSRLLDRSCQEYLLGLDRETAIVFQCHHGIRSQAAAEYFLRQGFRNVSNLQGGIDAWSQLVDPALPRY